MRGIIGFDLGYRFVKSVFSINEKNMITRILGGVWNALPAFAVSLFGSANKLAYGSLRSPKFGLCQTSNTRQTLSAIAGMEVV